MVKKINKSIQTLLRRGALIALLFACVNNLQAQIKDSITVQLNKNNFLQGDTISMEINLINYIKVAKTASIHLWVEEIKTGRKWHYRYPLVNGYLNAKLAINDSIKNGVYAFNFVLQKTFFNLTGKVKNADKNDKLLNYVMIAKNKQTIVDVVALDEEKSFSVGHLLFQDSAFIIFSKPKQKINDLLIDIKTPLDSLFTSVCRETRLITIGKQDNILQKEVSNYIFKANTTKYKTILAEVIVKAKVKRQAEEFEKENVSGLFSGGDAILLDGLESDEIANAPDLYTYLSIKVGGLRLETDNQTGNRSFTWRNQPTDIFINEIKLDPDIPVWINPSDIALIKVFRPGTPVAFGSGQGGVIAIYTKTGEYRKTSNRNYSFFIVGYTGLESTWK